MPTRHDRDALRRFSIGRLPPPDYTQRSVKLRLFLFVAAVMLLAAVIERARDPQSWKWLWTIEQKINEKEQLNNRLEAGGLRTAADPAGTIVAAAEPELDSLAPAGQIDPVKRGWEQGWKDVLARLSADDHSLLFEILYDAKVHQAFSTEKIESAAALIDQAQKLWDDYQAVAFQSVAELNGDDQTQWVDVLRQVNARFTSDVRPALQAVIDGRPPTEAEENALRSLESTLVSLVKSQVQDDTIVFRPAEREFWFHELARVHDADPAALRKASLGRVAYLQLFKQPADYRGQLVTVKGTVRLARRVPAPPNYLGAKEYCVYWLHPAGGPDSPILIYALAAPAGFPKFDADRNLREDVEITGVFFKRCAYAGQGGTYTAPLLIANTPTWRPTPIAPANTPLGPTELAILAVAALLLTICIAAVLWKRSGPRYRAANQPQSGGFVDLGSLTLGPTAEEKIRELERQARGEGRA
jgi:hypothetical protein